MKVLVTGGAGFIASHVVDAYVALGHKVVIVDDLSRGSRRNLQPQATFYQADISNRSTLESIFQKERPEVVNHHAAQMDVRFSVQDPVFDAKSNILASLNLLELAVQNKARRFIYASTGGAIYGEPEILPATEQTPVRPLSPYGVSKHTVEHYLFIYRALYGLPYVVLRYGNVYGPRQSSKGEAGVVAIFCEQMLQNITPTIYGDGTKTRDYVEVSDVARANTRALDCRDGEIFNIATGVRTTDYEVFTYAREALGKAPFKPRFAPKRPGEVDHIVLDASKAREQFGWQAQVTVREGIKKTAAWFKVRQEVGSKESEAMPESRTGHKSK